MRGIEGFSPPTGREEEAPWMAPKGLNPGLKVWGRMPKTVRRFPALAVNPTHTKFTSQPIINIEQESGESKLFCDRFKARHRSLKPVNRHGCRFSKKGGPEARSRMLRGGGRFPALAINPTFAEEKRKISNPWNTYKKHVCYNCDGSRNFKAFIQGRLVFIWTERLSHPT